MKDFVLTENQRRIAEEQHCVLEAFLSERKLPAEDFYDELVFAFLRAVRIYDECGSGCTTSFEPIAHMCLTLALEEYGKAKKKQPAEVFSLDAPMPGRGARMKDVLEDPEMDVCSIVCNKLCKTSGKRHRISHKLTLATRPMAAAVYGGGEILGY